MSSKDKAKTECIAQQKYILGNHVFVVDLVFKTDTAETVGNILLKLLKNDVENSRI